MLPTHGDEKYSASSLLTVPREWDAVRIERRHIPTGPHNAVRAACTELLHVISGKAMVRYRADGPLRERMALPGTNWLVPAGTEETFLELDGSTECVIIYLPAHLLEQSALAEYEVAPDNGNLIYEGGFADPTLAQLTGAMGGLLERPQQSIDHLFVDGIRAALGAHLVANYNVGNWRPATRQPSLEPKRLHRVLDYIETRLGETISLDDLAGEACLSPFHFARLFAQAMGQPPHRYVVERRVAAARQLLARPHSSMAEVALETGFGTQANFSRVFRKLTGLTPRQYRDLQRA